MTVQVPVSNPPVASFTYTCGPTVAAGNRTNACDFDAACSTDENAATLTYTWNFGNGHGLGAGGPPHLHAPPAASRSP